MELSTRSNLEEKGMIKSGFLHQNFRLFHLKDKTTREFEYHYHDFHKIIIFLSGNVTYMIEGKAYFLKPWDILLVNHHDVHKPVIDPNVTYERIIIWLQNDFLLEEANRGCDLSSCFQRANERSFNLIRLQPEVHHQLQTILSSLENALHSNEFGSAVLSNAFFLEFMVYINRIFLGTEYIPDTSALKYDKQIEEILKYINEHLAEELSNDALATRFFLNKYYLMHKFKDETGYPLHQYIQQKRLLAAKDLLLSGQPVGKVHAVCGFKDYSTFFRAYKKFFGCSPKETIPSS